MTLHIIATGGTLDKHYNELTGELGFSDSHLPAMIARARFTTAPTLEQLPPLDSLDMQDSDRQQILRCCERAAANAIVITHGTDTMPETGLLLGQAKLPKTIVLTGAMIPYVIDASDALFNFGLACGVAQVLPPGVYIAMNGQIFDWHTVRKNRRAGVFERHSALGASTHPLTPVSAAPPTLE